MLTDRDLRALRSSEEGAVQAITQLYAPLISSSKKVDLWSDAFVALAAAIETISNNCVSVDDADQHLKRAIYATFHFGEDDLAREQSGDLLVPRSTKSYRKKKGLPEYEDIKRKRGRDQVQYDEDVEYRESNGHLNSATTLNKRGRPNSKNHDHVVTQKNGEKYTPSRLVTHAGEDLDISFAVTDEEQLVGELWAVDAADEDIADNLGLTLKQVKQIKQRLRERADAMYLNPNIKSA